jgi:HlyD family secretion protein
MSRPRYLRWTVIAVVVLLLAWLAMRPAATWVDSARVGTGDVVASLEAEGRTRLGDRYLITAPIAAQARRLALEAGDPVAVGEVLVVLDSLPAPALDPRARAEAAALAEAAASQERAALAREADRLAQLGERALVAREAVERARTLDQRARRESASARFRVATAQHQLEAARAALALGSRARSSDSALELTSPVDGVVLRRHFESSRPVLPGEALLEIGDPGAMEVEVDVLSADAVRLREGMSVELHRWGEEAPLLGRLRRIEPAGFTKVSALGVEEQRVWVIVDITSERARWERLGDAYRVNARFLLDQRQAVTRVPASALFRDDDGWSAFRVEGGRARLAAVKPGLAGGAWVEIIEGLAPGDTVIVHPGRDLADGDRVRLRGG